MVFRDESEALRARVQTLQNELRDAERRNDDLSRQLHERDEVRERNAEAERNAQRAVQGSGSGPSTLVVGVALLLCGTGGAVAYFGLSSSRPQGMPGSPTFFTGNSSPDDAEVLPPTLGLVDLVATPEPAALDMTATGARSAPGECRGYLPNAPQLVLRASRAMAVRLAPVAVGDVDLVLAIRTPDGRVLCDDDGGGSRNPLLTTVLPAGDTRVWLGTYGEDGNAPARFAITSRPADAIPDASGLAPSATPTLGSVTGPRPGVAESFTGSVAPLVAATSIDPSCRGYLPLAPQLAVTLAEPGAVRFHARATDSTDLVLFLREPDGSVRCDDDAGHGNEPQIATLVPAGRHLVWVGTFQEHAAPLAVTLDTSAFAVVRDAAPTMGRAALTIGQSQTFSGETRDDVSPRSLGAPCDGGLVGVAPHVAIDLAQPTDVVLTTTGHQAPFLVLEHSPGQRFECVGDATHRAHWPAGKHNVYLGVPDESERGPVEITVRAEAPSLRAWTP